MPAPAPIRPGWPLGPSRVATCRQCSRKVDERLIGTDETPKGVWLFICPKCGS